MPKKQIKPERPLSKNERKIVDWLSHAIEACEKNIDNLSKAGRYQSSADQAARLLTINLVREGIISGLHDANHKTRVIYPKVTARHNLANGN